MIELARSCWDFIEEWERRGPGQKCLASFEDSSMGDSGWGVVPESAGRWRQNKTETVLGDDRPVAALEPRRAGGIRVPSSTRTLNPRYPYHFCHEADLHFKRVH